MDYRVIKLGKGIFDVECRESFGSWVKIKSFKSVTKANEYIAIHSTQQPPFALKKTTPAKQELKQKHAPARNNKPHETSNIRLISSRNYISINMSAIVGLSGYCVEARVKELTDEYVTLAIPLRSGNKLVEKIYF